MIYVRPSEQRGRSNFGWLDSRHTFSFSEYHDPDHMGFGPLRVLNEDRVQKAMGFDTHGHKNMEIISYVLSGALAHKDSTSNGSVIRPGDVQLMSAGTGILHSEFNNSRTEPVHFLQIWIMPDRTDVSPRYVEKAFPEEVKRKRLCLVVSPDGRHGSLLIHQNADIYASVLNAGEGVVHKLLAWRMAWVQVARGELDLNGRNLKAGDGAMIRNESVLGFTAHADRTEFLLIELPQS